MLDQRAALYENDIPAAVEILTRRIDLRAAVAIDHKMLVQHLADLANRGAGEALDRLREIEALGGTAGAAARRTLDRFDPQKRLEDRDMIWYAPSEGTALSIEFNSRGKAIGWHMTEPRRHALRTSAILLTWPPRSIATA